MVGLNILTRYIKLIYLINILNILTSHQREGAAFEDSRDSARAGRTAQLEQSESRGVPSTRHEASQAQDQV